jgi:hypothetical protein
MGSAPNQRMVLGSRTANTNISSTPAMTKAGHRISSACQRNGRRAGGGIASHEDFSDAVPRHEFAPAWRAVPGPGDAIWQPED